MENELTPNVNQPTGKVRGPRPRFPFSIFRRTKVIGGRKVELRNWYVRFRVPGPDGKRQQHTECLATEDREEALRRAAKMVLTKSPTTATKSENPTLDLFLEEYRLHLLTNKSKTGGQNEWITLRAIMRDLFPDWSKVRLTDVTTNLITNYITRRRNEENLRPWSVYHIRQALHAMFNYAILQKGFPNNPAKDVPKPRIPLSQIQYLRKIQIAQVLKAVSEQDPILLGPVATAIFAGLRRNEIVWMTWDDVNLDRKIINVRFKRVDGEYYEPKTYRPRLVPISNDLYPILKSLPQKARWAFPSPKGMRWEPNNLTHRLERLMEKHEGWDFTFLTFRHTFGSQLAQKGVSLYKIATLMGNSEKVCRDHYAALAVEDLQTEIDIFGDAAKLVLPPNGDKPAPDPGNTKESSKASGDPAQ